MYYVIYNAEIYDIISKSQYIINLVNPILIIIRMKRLIAGFSGLSQEIRSKMRINLI